VFCPRAAKRISPHYFRDCAAARFLCRSCGIPVLASISRIARKCVCSDHLDGVRDTKKGIDADKIVFVGFSAGGVVTSGTMLADNPTDQPNFVAPIYGAPFGALPSIPAGTPPAFIAVAEDDPIAAVPVLKFFGALRDAKLAPELHVYRTGKHGFSMSQRGTSDHWIEELYWWMESYGLTHP
jgi:acetyl esterase/lipase